MYRKFKGDLSFGYARFGNEANIKNGFVIAIEPKFMVLDQLAIGGRFETVLLGKNFEDQYSDDFQVKAYQSFLANAEYYFTKNYSIRPFAGAGAGVYSLSETGTVYSTTYDNSGSPDVKFGSMIRAGVEIKHLRIALEYNFVPNTTNDFYNNNGEIFTQTSKNAYFAVKVGFCFGGGPLNRD